MLFKLCTLVRRAYKRRPAAPVPDGPPHGVAPQTGVTKQAAAAVHKAKVNESTAQQAFRTVVRAAHKAAR